MNSSFECPECKERQNQVINSREKAKGMLIKRRRKCKNGHRFNTVERIAPKYQEDSLWKR